MALFPTVCASKNCLKSGQVHARRPDMLFKSKNLTALILSRQELLDREISRELATTEKDTRYIYIYIYVINVIVRFFCPYRMILQPPGEYASWIWSYGQPGHHRGRVALQHTNTKYTAINQKFNLVFIYVATAGVHTVWIWHHPCRSWWAGCCWDFCHVSMMPFNLFLWRPKFLPFSF